jgi:selenide,water dikinase
MCWASQVGAEIEAGRVPVLSPQVWELIQRDCVPGGTRQNLRAANEWTTWTEVGEAERILLADAQTSGGLLLCVAPRRLESVRRVVQQARAPCAAVIGRVVAARDAGIRVRP